MKKIQSIIFISFMSFLCFLVSSCFFFGSTSDGDLDDAGDHMGSKNLSALEKDSLPHPRQPTAWATKAFIVSQNKISEQDLSQCEKETMVLAEQEATSQESMIQAMDNMIPVVGTKPEFYHYCLYKVMSVLDEKMEDQGSLIQERGVVFLKGMRALWILSKALDQVRKVDFYFNYVQKRYVQISQDYFARSLEVTSPDAILPLKPQSGSSQLKPAGAFQDE